MSELDAAARQAAYRVCLIACLGVCLSSLEWLWPWHKLALWAPLDAARHARGGWRSKWQPAGLRALLLLRFGCALGGVVGCCAAAPAYWTAAAATLAGLCSLLLRADEPLGLQAGLDGGEHMLMLSLVSAGTSLWLGASGAVALALAWVAAAALLEYGSAGWFKLRAWRGWWTGAFLQRVIATSNYGYPRWVQPLARWPRAASALSASVVGLELLLPCTPLLGAPYAELLLAGALLFHLGTGAVMGLNSFVWGFGAAYPAILFCRDWLQA